MRSHPNSSGSYYNEHPRSQEMNPIQKQTSVEAVNDFLPKRSYRPSTYTVRIQFPGKNITEADLVTFLFEWDLLDALQIILCPDEKSFDIVFKSDISAHVISKINGVKLIRSDEISPFARVPAVYLNGIPPETTDEAIHSYFSTVSKIIKIKRVVAGSFHGFVLKLPSVDKAQKLANLANKESFNKSQMTASCQYKKTITNCFYVNCGGRAVITPQDVTSEISQFGSITDVFIAKIATITSVLIKMENNKAAKLACGFMNHRLFDGFPTTAIFISESYYDELKQHIRL